MPSLLYNTTRRDVCIATFRTRALKPPSGPLTVKGFWVKTSLEGKTVGNSSSWPGCARLLDVLGLFGLDPNHHICEASSRHGSSLMCIYCVRMDHAAGSSNSCQLLDDLDERASHISWHPPYETNRAHASPWSTSWWPSTWTWTSQATQAGVDLFPWRIKRAAIHIFPKRVEPLLFGQLDYATLPLALQKALLTINCYCTPGMLGWICG